MIRLFYENYFDKAIITFILINAILLMARLTFKSIKLT